MSSNNVVAAPWRTLLPVYIACFAFGVQAGTVMPLIPLALERHGIDNFIIGLMSAVLAGGSIAMTPFIPKLAARIGAVPLICLAQLVSAAVLTVAAFTFDLTLWFGLSVIAGIVSVVPWVVSEIWINLVIDEGRRGRAVALYATLLAVGLAIGPLILQLVGVTGPRPFLTAATIYVVIAVFLLPTWRTAPRVRAHEKGGFLHVMRLAPMVMLAAFAAGLGEQAAFSFLPVYAVSSGISLERGTLWLSAFVIGNLALQWPIGWAADRWDRRKVLVFCTLVSAALTALLPLVDLKGAHIYVHLLLWGGISFGCYVVGLALLGQRFRGGDIAAANAAFAIFYMIGGLVGRPITGAAMDTVGVAAGFGPSIAIFYLIAGVGALLALRRRG